MLFFINTLRDTDSERIGTLQVRHIKRKHQRKAGVFFTKNSILKLFFNYIFTEGFLKFPEKWY
jgi:hypothetical protein